MAEEDTKSPFDTKKTEEKKDEGSLSEEMKKYIKEHPNLFNQLRKGYKIIVDLKKGTTDITFPNDKDKEDQ